jgi:DNA-binding NtrC family response regulator
MPAVNLLGPALVLYLVVELISSAGTVDPTGIFLAVTAVVMSLVPVFVPREDEAPAARRVAWLALGLGVGLLSVAQSDWQSPPLELTFAIAWPWAGTLSVDLALDAPDRPPGLLGIRGLRVLSHAVAFMAGVASVLVVLPPFELFGFLVLTPASWISIGPILFMAQLLTALAIRIARRRLGSAPEALASNGSALLGIAFALCAGAFAISLVAIGIFDRGAPVVRGLVCAGAGTLVLGHIVMVDAVRPIQAARASRRVVAAAFTAAVLGVVGGVFAHSMPIHDPVAFGVSAAAFLAIGAFVFRLMSASIDSLFAPDGGRLLRALKAAEREYRGARTLEEMAQAVLVPLRIAARSIEARPFLQTIDPAKQVGIDAAGEARIEVRELSAAIVARFTEQPGTIIIYAPLAAMIVRRPEVRPLAEALELLEALCVVPIVSAGELEGALVVPRGRRRAPLTLEELSGLERLAQRLSGPLAMHQAEARARERAGRLLLTNARLEERIEALEDELAGIRTHANALKNGTNSDALAAPPVAYSAAMRALVQRVEDMAATDAPLQLVAETGLAIDSIAHLIHRASSMREGPFVLADCASVRPEHTLAALVGDDGAGQPGWLRLARGGTLVLVDTPALSLEAQSALAEAIASRMVHAAGGASPYHVEIRLVAHLRVETSQLVSAGTFDAELARRLEPLRLELPPLRARREDLASLVLLAIDRACRTLGRPTLGIDEAAMARLMAHDFRGNSGELQSLVDRAVARAEAPRIRECDLHELCVVIEETNTNESPFEGTWSDIEQRILRDALERAAGNKSEAARLLGLKRTTFLDKLRRAGFDVPDSMPPVTQ